MSRDIECVSRQWCRLTNMAETRINKAIFKWAYRLAIKGKKNIQKLTMDFYNRIGMNHLSNNELLFSSIKDDLKLVLSEHFVIIWFIKLTRQSAMRGTGLNKLRTYRKYKQSILTEPYVIAPPPCQNVKICFGHVPTWCCTS